MSRLHPQTFPCRFCGATLSLGIVSSINADRRPDLRQAVLDDEFQRGNCDRCGQPYRVEPELTFLDVARRQWILVRPGGNVDEWPALEQVAQQAFDRAHGEQAPDAARALGQGLQVRIAFGWAALREKLLCAEHGLDDTTLELLKFALMRSADSLELADDRDLRLTGASADSLELTWLLAGGQLAFERLEAPRALLDEIAADADGAWAALRAEVAAGPFVDVNRVLVPAEAQDA